MSSAPTTTPSPVRSDRPAAATPSFGDLGLPQRVVEALTVQGLHAPFAIQVSTIPDALAGRDVCGRAPTGSGKTLAFSLPTAVRVGRARPGHPTALILTPTRELAKQVMETIQPLAKAKKRWVATFYGGTSVKRDLAVLRKGVDIAVATPGRLADLVQQGALSLDECRIVVLDEADRMADMGFLPEVKRLLDRTPSDRQTLLFSATLDGDVDVLVRRYQNNPARHEVEAAAEARGDVRHHFWHVDRAERKDLTHQILARTGPAIVFTRTKHGADRLAKQLRTLGVETAAIHGNRSQNQRERALKQFARGEVTALIATDVAARGIHVDGVDAVVHYDLPGSDKDYVHRSGRTGRAGATGTVVTFVMPEQRKDARAIQRDLSGELDGVTPGVDDADLTALGAPRERPVRPATRDDGQRPASNRNNNRNNNRNAKRKRANSGRSKDHARTNTHSGPDQANGRSRSAKTNGRPGSAKQNGHTGSGRTNARTNSAAVSSTDKPSGSGGQRSTASSGQKRTSTSPNANGNRKRARRR